jgi:hypothetical protein
LNFVVRTNYDPLKMTSLDIALYVKTVLFTAVVSVVAKSRAPDRYAMVSSRRFTKGTILSIKVT